MDIRVNKNGNWSRRVTSIGINKVVNLTPTWVDVAEGFVKVGAKGTGTWRQFFAKIITPVCSSAAVITSSSAAYPATLTGINPHWEYAEALEYEFQSSSDGNVWTTIDGSTISNPGVGLTTTATHTLAGSDFQSSLTYFRFVVTAVSIDNTYAISESIPVSVTISYSPSKPLNIRYTETTSPTLDPVVYLRSFPAEATTPVPEIGTPVINTYTYPTSSEQDKFYADSTKYTPVTSYAVSWEISDIRSGSATVTPTAGNTSSAISEVVGVTGQSTTMTYQATHTVAGAIRYTWDAVTGATKYKVLYTKTGVPTQQKTTSGVDALTGTPNLEYTVTGLSLNDVVNMAVVSSSTLRTYIVEWDVPTSDGGSSIDHYEWSYTGLVGSWTALSSGAVRAWIVTNNGPADAYLYVRAVNSVGSGENASTRIPHGGDVDGPEVTSGGTVTLTGPLSRSAAVISKTFTMPKTHDPLLTVTGTMATLTWRSRSYVNKYKVVWFSPIGGGAMELPAGTDTWSFNLGSNYGNYGFSLEAYIASGTIVANEQSTPYLLTYSKPPPVNISLPSLVSGFSTNTDFVAGYTATGSQGVWDSNAVSYSPIVIEYSSNNFGVIAGSRANGYTIAATDAKAPSYWFRAKVVAWNGPGQTGQSTTAYSPSYRSRLRPYSSVPTFSILSNTSASALWNTYVEGNSSNPSDTQFISSTSISIYRFSDNTFMGSYTSLSLGVAGASPITGLAAGTAYYGVVTTVANDSALSSTLSSPGYFSTTSPPPPAPTNSVAPTLLKSAEDARADSVLTCTDGTWSGAASYAHFIEYANDSSFSTVLGSYSTSRTVTSLDALYPSYWFRAKVIAYSGAGQTGTASSPAYSEVIRSHLVPYSNSPSFSAVGFTTATCNFTVGTTPASAINYIYAVRVDVYSVIGNTLIGFYYPSSLSSNSVSVSITGLSISTQYYTQILVTANDSAGTTVQTPYSGSTFTTTHP